jgi:O-antigen/teichoic acid export membrane protein
MSETAARTTFFRQSGWLMLAAVVSGACNFAVHPFAKKIPESEYGVLGTMLAMLNCMAIPAMGLQMVFTQQTAAAVTEEKRRELAGTTRGVLKGTLFIWLVIAILIVCWQRVLLEQWQISNPAALWLMLAVGIAALWTPLFAGILQGRQNFLWVGWASMLNGAGRLAGVAVSVLVFHAYAAGMVGGIVFGMAISLLVLGWQARTVWRGAAGPVVWRPWLARVVPLTLGFGSFQFMLTADPLFVQAWFDKNETGFYIAAGTLARALVIFTGPIAVVMFPKIVRSVALREPTRVMGVALATAAGLAGLGAVGLSVVAPPLLTLVYKESYLAAVPLLRWFSWCVLPLAAANVLLNDLLARERFGLVPWLGVVLVGYIVALNLFHDSFLTVIRTLGAFNLLFLGVVVAFTWRDRKLREANTAPLSI